MKKQLLSWMMIFVALCLLCACGSTKPADAQTEHSEEATTAESDDGEAGNAPIESEAVPTEHVEPLSAAPEAADGLFFSCRNLHYYFLQDLEGATFDFYILSEEALSPEEIVIDTGLEAQGRTDITELKLAGYSDQVNGGTVPDGFTVPNEVLLSEKISDWGPIRELEALYASAETDSERAERFEALRSIIGDIWSAMAGNTEQDHPAPDFHAYMVTVHLTAYTGKIETTQSVTIHIKGRSYCVNCGSVTVDSLYTESELQHADPDVLMKIKFALSLGSEPCAGGWITTGMTSMFGFLARDNVTLTGLSLLEEDREAYELRSIVLSVTDAEGLTTEFEWDGGSPVLLKTGSTADFFLVLYDPRADSFIYSANPHVVLSYRQMKGEACSQICPIPVKVAGDPYILHAQYAEGVNMEAYYRYIFKMMYSSDELHRLNYGFDRP